MTAAGQDCVLYIYNSEQCEEEEYRCDYFILVDFLISYGFNYQEETTQTSVYILKRRGI